MKIFVTASVVAVFAMPLSVGAAGDKAASTSAANSGAEKMFEALDKNKDGFLSRDEVKGTPHEKDFAKLDKNNDGKLTRQEHAAAPEHAGEKAASGATGGSAASGEAGSTSPSPSRSQSKPY